MLERFGRTPRLRVAVASGAVLVALTAMIVVVAAMNGGGAGEAPAATTGPDSTATPTRTNTPTATPEASPTPIKHAGILDGVAMTDEEWEARKDQLPLAVMLDNTASANPHAGLIDADLVYEAFVEGGITRLMAVYWRQDASRILPVRSARTPFVNWVAELGAMYAHAGGAVTENEANAIGQIAELGIKDLNAFSPVSSNYYYRDSSRSGPYDLATSTGYLREAASQLGFSGPPSVSPWSFREPGTPLPPGVPAGGIEVDYSGRLYAWQYIQWKWDSARQRYLRFQFGGPDVDADSGEQLAFSTVIVMRVPSYVVDDVGHVLLDQVGTGAVTVFTGGQAYEGTWKKDSRTGRTQFLTPRGDPIVFERGPIFIQAISIESTFDYTASPGDLRELPRYEPPPPGSGPEVGEDTPVPVTETPTAGATAPPAATRTPQAPSPTGAAGTPSASPATPAPSTATPGPTQTAPSPATPGGSITVTD